MKKVLPEYITDVGKNFQRTVYSKKEKELLLDYMKNDGELFAAGGYVTDAVTEKTTRIADGGYRDEQYEWSMQDIYHIEEYDATVKKEFIDYVKSKKAV